MTTEGVLLAAAARVGVPVPEVIASGDGSRDIGVGYLITDFIDGETIPRRILRDEHLAPARAVLAGQCGRILAAVHRIPPAEVRGLGGASDPVGQLRAQLDQLGQPHPAFELGRGWLEEHRRPRAVTAVVHGDFRNGNLIVGEEGIRAVLDWELAHVGDPIEDLGWLCVRAWRFGSPLAVGGFGTVDELLAAYEAAGGEHVEESALRWWIVYGTLRWGIICIAQVLTHLSGAFRSVELAAIGRRVCEVESDLLELLPWGDPGAQPSPVGVAPSAFGLSPHDVPSAAELLEAVRSFLDSDVIPVTEGRVRFHARVASNVVAMVSREIATAPQLAAAHATRLAGLGVESDTELAGAIRSGRFDELLNEVTDAVRATVADKLAVANPGYSEPRPAGA